MRLTAPTDHAPALALLRLGLAVLLLLLSPARAAAAEPGQYAYLVGGAPIATVAVTITSASTGTLPGGSCFRVACTAQVFFRVGVLPLTALTTDNVFTAGAEMICLRAGYNGVAFVIGTGTATCTVNTLAPSP